MHDRYDFDIKARQKFDRLYSEPYLISNKVFQTRQLIFQVIIVMTKLALFFNMVKLYKIGFHNNVEISLKKYFFQN